MDRDNRAAIVAAHIARQLFRLKKVEPFHEPKKIIILIPCCLSQVMLATPLLAVLNKAFPQAQIDWAVDEWSKPAVSGNPRIKRIIDTGSILQKRGKNGDTKRLIATLREGGYDTCFVPSRSVLLGYIAWRAGIRQRIGLNANGRGFAYTVPVNVPKDPLNEASLYLKLAKAVGVDGEAGLEFYPSDRARSSITRLVVEDLGWTGEKPLVIFHPGGGENPTITDLSKRWPAERFALLGSLLIREFGARVVVVGAEDDKKLAADLDGFVSAEITNLAGQLDLDQIGALAEVADLYVGNDTGPTHVAAAVGCKTLAIFGPSDPALSAPYGTKGQVIVAAPDDVVDPFAWSQGPSVEKVFSTARVWILGGRESG